MYARRRLGLLRTLLMASAAVAMGTQIASARDHDHHGDDMHHGRPMQGGHVQGTFTPAGQIITPNAAPGASFGPLNPGLADYPGFVAGQATTTVTSPDGNTLLILTSGYNRIYKNGSRDTADSDEYIFVYNIANDTPVQKQVIKVANTFDGIAFAPDGQHFYVGGGKDDDVHVYGMSSSSGMWSEVGTPVALGHTSGVGLAVGPETAGLAVSADGSTLVVANFYNDSISTIPLSNGLPVTGSTPTEIQLRPGIINAADAGVAGGEYPYWVAIKGNDTAYVSSERDREIDVVHFGTTPQVVKRIKVSGNPNRMVLSKDGSTLYVASDNEAIVSVIDTASNSVVDTINTSAPASYIGVPKYFHGTEPNSVTLSPDGNRLYVTNGGTNSVAVIALDTPKPEVMGLLPTGYYPESVSLSADGKQLYIVNGKSNPGPNPCNFKLSTDVTATCKQFPNNNAYILQLSKAGFLTEQVPSLGELAHLTQTVAQNNHFGFREHGRDRGTMEFLHHHIKHIIYIIRENRTYDQILGDLGEGNGDANLTEFGKSVTPNAHEAAWNFVDFDNFYDTGEVSGNGWPWSTSARESDFGTKALPVNYAGRGLSYDWEGTNRNVDVAIPTLAGRLAANPLLPNDPNILPGTNNVAAPDGPTGQKQRGYIWDAALRAGLSIHNYGFFINLDRYGRPVDQFGIPLLTDPYATKTTVAYSTDPVLGNYTDPYFRGFDNNLPDYYRFTEWKREFNNYVKHDSLPSLEFVRLMHDHTGSFSTAIDGVNTPTTQVADNDYAVGKLIDTVAHSRYANSTLIFVVEDDAQDGPDHVDAHRSEAFIVGPYVKHHAVDSSRYSTVNMIRTMEDILGFGPLTLNDAYQRPMADAFDPEQRHWTFNAKFPPPLKSTSLPNTTSQTQADSDDNWKPPHSAAWWSAQTKGFDWHKEDKIPALKYDHILWRGLMKGKPYPTVRDQTADNADN